MGDRDAGSLVWYAPKLRRPRVRGPDGPRVVMQKDDPNDTCVASWTKRAMDGLSGEECVQLLEMALAALWLRSRRPLGDVTVAAIMDRVVHVAGERFPVIAGLQVEASAVTCVALRSRAAEASAAELREAVHFLLVEYLTILGNLTADILSPALRHELSTVALGTARTASRGGNRTSRRRKR